MLSSDMLLAAAVAEVHRLREALAYEAAVSQAHGGFATFPKSRRAYLEDQVARMASAARGDSAVAYAGVSSLSLRSVRRAFGVPDVLTVDRFAQDVSEAGSS